MTGKVHTEKKKNKSYYKIKEKKVQNKIIKKDST